MAKAALCAHIAAGDVSRSDVSTKMAEKATDPGGALPSAAAGHHARFGRTRFWAPPAACVWALLLAVCFTTGSRCAGAHANADLPAQGYRRAAGAPGQATCGPGSPCTLPFRPFAALRGGGGGGESIGPSLPSPALSGSCCQHAATAGCRRRYATDILRDWCARLSSTDLRSGEQHPAAPSFLLDDAVALVHPAAAAHV
jgi:hypothetical protein